MTIAFHFQKIIKIFMDIPMKKILLVNIERITKETSRRFFHR
jgi:hypothetical protein